jgi:hypothetical protein
MFKRPSKNGDINKTQNWLLEIPAKLDITLDDLKKRRVMDQRKWFSVIKTNIDKSKGNGEIQW